MVLIFAGNTPSLSDSTSSTEVPPTQILAARYKTRTCKTFMATGHCPYHHRCMFAHGAAEVRTVAMNLNDGLVTGHAIRQYQKFLLSSTAYDGELTRSSSDGRIGSFHDFAEFPSPTNSSGRMTHNPYAPVLASNDC